MMNVGPQGSLVGGGGCGGARTQEHSSLWSQELSAHMAVMNIIRSYQMRGHLLADLDPLGISYGHLTDAELASGDQAGRSKPAGLSAATVLRQHKVPASSDADWERQYVLPDNSFIGMLVTGKSLRVIVQKLCNIK